MNLLIFNRPLRPRLGTTRRLPRGRHRGLRTGVLQLALLLGAPSLAPAQDAGAKSCLERPEICGASTLCCEQYELAEKYQKNISDSSLRKDPARKDQLIKNALAQYNAAFAVEPTAAIKLKIARMHFFQNDQKQYKKDCDEAAELLEKLRSNEEAYKRVKRVLDDYQRRIRPELTLAIAEPPPAELRPAPPPTPVPDARPHPLPVLVAPAAEKTAKGPQLGVWAGFGIGAGVTLAVTGSVVFGFLLAKQHDYNSTLQGTM